MPFTYLRIDRESVLSQDNVRHGVRHKYKVKKRKRKCL